MRKLARTLMVLYMIGMGLFGLGARQVSRLQQDYGPWQRLTAKVRQPKHFRVLTGAWEQILSVMPEAWATTQCCG